MGGNKRGMRKSLYLKIHHTKFILMARRTEALHLSFTVSNNVVTIRAESDCSGLLHSQLLYTSMILLVYWIEIVSIFTQGTVHTVMIWT